MISSMKLRVAYLNRQATEFRKLAEASHDASMRAQLVDLARRCETIAANISKNMPIHERTRKAE
jgi:hypothetical protein